MAFKGKRAKEARKTVDRNKLYELGEAIDLVKKSATAKFDETVEMAINLGVDPRHADQMVRGVVQLPNGSGRTVRVGVFARDAKAEEAKEAGADVVGAEDLMEIVQSGKIDFDRCIANTGYDAAGWPLGQDFGTARYDAEPESGNRDTQCGRCGERCQGRRGRIPG